jgi:undecaprenyl pyrophosphate synthase
VFNTLESLYVHFSHPSKNQKLTEIQTKLGIKHTTMIRLSNTNWNCCYRNIESVKNIYKVIIQALEEEIENEYDRRVNKAIGII